MSYGIDYYVTRTSRSATAVVRCSRQPGSGTSSPANAGLSQHRGRQLAVFLQDEIVLMNGRLRLSPGLRYDEFEADARADEIFLAGNPGSPTPEDFEDSQVTAKVGVVYEINDIASLYARYSEGFRAPPYDDVNIGFTNFIGGYKTISNPDLESETSEGIEAGLRLQGGYGYVKIAAFRNDYDNFIESLTIAPQFAATGGIDPADGLLTFQSINLSEVQIDGVELTGTLDLARLGDALAGFTVRGSVAYANGEDKTGDAPLNSVQPLTTVLGLGYDDASGNWGGQLIWTLVASKDAADAGRYHPDTHRWLWQGRSFGPLFVQ
ncbi:MAG: TonB-dependent receptor [Gammaproteobacteria bacterium]|nr:TonB-dependent receptor [Gammaproteobacteria bacterium]